jgi:nicotinamide phosphoribosyltransferase
LMRSWYPITVATQSWYIKNDILRYLNETADDPAAEIDFKLHDFGARGVSSSESAGIGGAAHLVNFKGSDTVEGVFLANKYYNSPMAAFSIPAAEHSTITSWGKDREYEAFGNMLTQFSGPGKLVACVSDSFDIYAATKWWADQSERIKATGGTLVIRPDSGDPATVCKTILDILAEKGLMTENSKGYRVLPSHLRVIQGDGVNRESITHILETLKQSKYSASNIAFGMGGALLQKVDRDTQKMAYKCSAVQIAGTWNDVYKDPITDPGKTSKRGILDLIAKSDKTYETVVNERWDSCMQTVYHEGVIDNRITTLDQVRNLADWHR